MLSGLVHGQHGFAKVKEEDEAAVLCRFLEPWCHTGRSAIADALHTERGTAQHILDCGPHYILAVKGNQPTLQALLRDDY